jgi:ribosome biogenesis GTPase
LAKRRLSKQQQSRIQKLQDRSRERAKTIPDEDIAAGDFGSEQQGLLITHYGRYVDVESVDKTVHRCYLRQNIEPLVVGDTVIWREKGDKTGVVTALLPRHTLLWRPEERNQKKLMAANINLVAIVIAPDPPMVPLLLDSYLVAMEYLGIKPIIVLNKQDLFGTANPQYYAELIENYLKIGYDVVKTSLITGSGLDELKAHLQGHVSIFIGQSGVGKSSLIHALVPHMDIIIGELSAQKGHGAHTTTRAHLYHLPSGGDLIDSPGIRDFKLWHLAPSEIALSFKEFQQFLNQCRFNNCLHTHEPGCAILEAVAAGEISQARLANYQALISTSDPKKY